MTSQPTDLEQLKLGLESPELAPRLRALTALTAYDTSTAVPLLCAHLDEADMLVRLLVATGLGRKRSPQSFQALTALLMDSEAQVRSEAVLSLSRFGPQSRPLLWQTFREDADSLVRAAVLEAIAILSDPLELFKVCTLALGDSDVALQELATLHFRQFADTDMRTAALDHLQPLARNPHGPVRAALARSLHAFDSYRAREILTQLHDDADHRVVAAVLEGLV